jgi:pantetheine-phosphate adenylyltransferase
MSRAVCPGSFDPVTLGHLDIIGKASRLFDEVIVAIGVNPSKNRLFGPEERIDMLERATAGFANVRVAGFTGLVTDFCTQHDVQAIVKGLRAASDFDYELPMAQMNHALTGVETVFLPTSTGRSYVSSSLVKEVATFGGDVSALLPPFVNTALLATLDRKKSEARS